MMDSESARERDEAYDFQSEYENGEQVVQSAIQFSNKIIEPDMRMASRIKDVFPGYENDKKIKRMVENIRILYDSTTRDYALGNLSLPKSSKNSYDFVNYCHNEKSIMLLQGRPHLAMGFDIIMKGELLLSRGINMKQQEIFNTTFQRKTYDNIQKKSGLIPKIGR